MVSPVAMCLYLSGLASGGLKEFQAGQPAKAVEINDNFRYLDSVLQRKASLVGLEAATSLAGQKADSGALGSIRLKVRSDSAALSSQISSLAPASALATKADTAAVGSLARQQKADVDALKASLQGVATSSSLAGLRDTVRGKLDTFAFWSFKRQTESGLAGKQAALGFTPLNAAGGGIAGELTVAKTLMANGGISTSSIKATGAVAGLQGRFDTVSVPGGLFTSFPNGDYGAIYGDQIATPGMGNYSLAWQRDGSISVMRSGGRYLVLRSGEVAPRYYDGSGEYDVLHGGNFPVGNVFLERGEAPADWAKLGVLGGYTVRPENYNGPDGVYNYGDLCVFGSGNMKTQIYFSHQGGVYVRTKWNEADWVGWKQWLTSEGGTIQGDLRVAGRLTTAPGEKPADYVFEPDYPLAPLSEVEAYTKAHKHLPEVPSAAAMETQGVDLARMNMVLLKKVEELTLHAIAQEKKLAEQGQILEDQRRELRSQQARIEEILRR